MQGFPGTNDMIERSMDNQSIIHKNVASFVWYIYYYIVSYHVNIMRHCSSTMVYMSTASNELFKYLSIYRSINNWYIKL